MAPPHSLSVKNVEALSKEMAAANLRGATQGAVYLAGDVGYDEARQGWNLVVEQAPRVIVDAETAEDVQTAIRYARVNGLSVAVMATGHGTPRGCDGMLIRTARMIDVQIDREARRARIQGGALVRDVLAAAAPYGLAMLSGSTTHVGVVGYTLGGGYGLMIRKHGLAIDRVREARIVTPQGDLVTASTTENPELFWAIRGGGGAFGVIVELTVELIEQPTVYGGVTFYAGERAREVLQAYAAWTREAPEEISTACLLMNLPPLPSLPEPLRGRAVVAINGCVCGDLADAEATVRPLRELGEPILDAWDVFPYQATDRIFNDPTDPMPCCVKGAVLRDLEPEHLDRLLDVVGPLEAMPQVCVQVRHIGGAMARLPRGETPIGALREAKYMAYTIGIPNPFASVAALQDNAEATLTALGDSVMCRGPLNFVGEGDVTGADIRGVYGEAEYERLRRVKAVLDPANAFRFASVGLVD